MSSAAVVKPRQDTDDYCVAPDSVHPRIGKISYENGVFYHNVDLTELPNFSALKDEVEKVIAELSWWQSYGVDSCILLSGVIGAVLSFFLMSSSNFPIFTAGVILLGCCHSVLAIKGGHVAAHKAVCQSAMWNRLLGFFFSDVCGTFPSDASYEIHVKGHHPHTNIMGLGDSSTFKAPLLPAFLYLFVAPLLLPIITPVVAVMTLWGRWFQLCRFLVIASFGLFANLYMAMTIAGCTLLGSLAITVVSRAVLAIPYIHVNIFQHIGLPMFSPRHRPKRLYQMSVGVLNLSSNPILDICFGHGIIRLGK